MATLFAVLFTIQLSPLICTLFIPRKLAFFVYQKYLHILKEILLEIGFVEEMRSTWGNKEVPQTFSPNTPYSRKYVLICCTPRHWQPCVSQFCDITKGVL